MILRTLFISVIILSANIVQAAELTAMECVQDDIVTLRFGADRAQKSNKPAVIRFESNAMHAQDANGQEHEYPVQFIGGPRYEAENWTMIFNPDLTSADVALVTMTDVQTAKWRCQKRE